MADVLGQVSSKILGGDAASIAKLANMSNLGLSRSLALNRVLDDNQAESIRRILTMAGSNIESGNTEEMNSLFKLLKTGKDSPVEKVFQTIEDIRASSKQKEFIDQTRMSNNKLSESIIKAYNNQQDGSKLQAGLSAGADLLGKAKGGIQELLGSDFDRLSSEQRGELRRLEISARQGSVGEKSKKLQDVVLRAQQYINQLGGQPGQGGSKTQDAVMKDISTALIELNGVMKGIHLSLEGKKPLYVTNEKPN